MKHAKIKPKENNMANHFVLLTGGSSGIGRAIAKSLILNGANVGIISRRDPNSWEDGPPKIWDPQKNWLKLDINDTDATKRSIRKWLRKVDFKLNTVIHCAVSYGYGSRHPLIKTSLDEWDEIFSTNVRAQFVIIREVLPTLKKQSKSLILGITSDVAFKPGPGRIAYAASKAASHSLFSSLSEELKGSNIVAVELLPARTVTTSGIRKRSPIAFDFSSYYSPQIFVKPVVSIVKSFGLGLRENLFIIDQVGINPVSFVLKITRHD